MTPTPELILVDRLGWPVEQFKNRPVLNFLRRIIHGRRRVWWLRVDGGLRQIDWAAVAAVSTPATAIGGASAPTSSPISKLKGAA